MPILFPGMIAVALFGFTLSYDEFPRSWLTAGAKNTLPLEIWTMTTNVTSPALYALGTVTTVVSFVVIALALSSIILIQRRRLRGHEHLHHRDREAVQTAAPATPAAPAAPPGPAKSAWSGSPSSSARPIAVKDINLTIPHGSYCCLLGPRAAARPRSCG